MSWYIALRPMWYDRCDMPWYDNCFLTRRNVSIVRLLDVWCSCVSSRGGTSLEQFVTFRLVVSIAASIQAEIEDIALHTLVPCHSYPAAEYWTNITRVKRAHIIWFYFVTWPWSSSEPYTSRQCRSFANVKLMSAVPIYYKSSCSHIHSIGSCMDQWTVNRYYWEWSPLYHVTSLSNTHLFHIREHAQPTDNVTGHEVFEVLHEEHACPVILPIAEV